MRLMPEHVLASPTGWLQRFAADVDVPPAADYERWWRERGQAISDAVDRAGRGRRSNRSSGTSRALQEMSLHAEPGRRALPPAVHRAVLP
jgi:hypothetical protein